MSGFKFKSSKISFPIVDEKDAEIKTYLIDIGSEKFLKEVISKGKEVVRDMEAVNDAGIDKVMESSKSFIDLVLGVGEFDFLYNKFDTNVFAITELVKVLSENVTEQWKKRTSIHD